MIADMQRCAVFGALSITVSIGLFVGGASAQRFDNWTSEALLDAMAPATNLATNPLSGAPVYVGLSGTTYDTVTWNGGAWVSMGLSNTPGLLAEEVLAPFSNSTTVGLVHLDRGGVTSVWTGGSGWTTLGILSPSPICDSLTSAVVTEPGPGGDSYLFCPGAFNTGELWSFNGATWTNRTPASGPAPTGIYFGTMVNTGGDLVYYGGQTTLGVTVNDLWQFDGAQWFLRGTGPTANGRYVAGMVFDLPRGQIVMGGGFTAQGGVLNDAWALAAPSDAVVTQADWSNLGTVPTYNSTGVTRAVRDTARQEFMLVDPYGNTAALDHVASVRVMFQSPTSNCVVPNFQLVASPIVEPRVPASGTNSVALGGLTGQVGAPLFWLAEFVPARFSLPSVTAIPGTSCFSMLSDAAPTIGTGTTGAGGQYVFNLLIPAQPALVGTVVATQVFGLTVSGPIPFIASQGLDIAIGR